MKRSFISILLLLAANICFCQTYVSLAPSLTNTAGILADKTNIALEIGRQWDVFSMGLDIGKTSLARVKGRDTTVYLELRPNLNIFQQGRFTNTFTAGIGYVFNGKENLVTELTSGIEYAYNQRLHFNINFGQYFYSGLSSASNVTFFGFSVMFYFKETETGSLIKKKAD